MDISPAMHRPMLPDPDSPDESQVPLGQPYHSLWLTGKDPIGP